MVYNAFIMRYVLAILVAAVIPACGGSPVDSQKSSAGSSGSSGISVTSPAPFDDSIAFYGDSITDRAFNRDCLPGYSEVINGKFPAFTPSYKDLGTSGWSSVDALANLDATLAANPGYKYWALCFGTNDAYFNTTPQAFKSNLRNMVAKLRTAGKIPVIPTIPYGIGRNAVAYNSALDDVVVSQNVMRGPDLDDWFFRHQEQLLIDGVNKAPAGQNGDDVHPGDPGRIMINVLWAQTMEQIYK